MVLLRQRQQRGSEGLVCPHGECWPRSRTPPPFLGSDPAPSPSATRPSRRHTGNGVTATGPLSARRPRRLSSNPTSCSPSFPHCPGKSAPAVYVPAAVIPRHAVAPYACSGSSFHRGASRDLRGRHHVGMPACLLHLLSPPADVRTTCALRSCFSKNGQKTEQNLYRFNAHDWCTHGRNPWIGSHLDEP